MTPGSQRTAWPSLSAKHECIKTERVGAATPGPGTHNPAQPRSSEWLNLRMLKGRWTLARDLDGSEIVLHGHACDWAMHSAAGHALCSGPRPHAGAARPLCPQAHTRCKHPSGRNRTPVTLPLPYATGGQYVVVMWSPRSLGAGHVAQGVWLRECAAGHVRQGMYRWSAVSHSGQSAGGA
mmetsp:Transcript_10303/g.22127  ORF Transcript_10303/g.22127 Transcript_10303/m.22127 type:complete len:180 (+) Transcript_10303:435-974(+)